MQVCVLTERGYVLSTAKSNLRRKSRMGSVGDTRFSPSCDCGTFVFLSDMSKAIVGDRRGGDMKQITVDELIATWTPGEREALKGLIEECREREKANMRARIETARGLVRLADNLIGQLAEEVLNVTKSNIKGRA